MTAPHRDRCPSAEELDEAGNERSVACHRIQIPIAAQEYRYGVRHLARPRDVCDGEERKSIVGIARVEDDRPWLRIDLRESGLHDVDLGGRDRAVDRRLVRTQRVGAQGVRTQRVGAQGVRTQRVRTQRVGAQRVAEQPGEVVRQGRVRRTRFPARAVVGKEHVVRLDPVAGRPRSANDADHVGHTGQSAPLPHAGRDGFAGHERFDRIGCLDLSEELPDRVFERLHGHVGLDSLNESHRRLASKQDLTGPIGVSTCVVPLDCDRIGPAVRRRVTHVPPHS